MTRKDSEKDSERPRYYSQFWLDIAAGRRVIGGPKPEEAEGGEAETPEPAPSPIRKTGYTSSGSSDGYGETHASTVAEPAAEEEDFEQANTVDEAELPQIVLDYDADEAEEAPAATVDEADEPADETEVIPEADAEEEESETGSGEEEEEDFYDDDEEEEEDDDWSPRGRKKAKPVKPVKPVKKPRREPRRGF